MAKRAKPKVPAPLVFLEPDSVLHVWLSSGLSKERETLRRLAHRVVDLLADSNRCGELAGSLGVDLGWMAQEFAAKHVTELVHKVCAPGKEVGRG